MKKIVIIAVTLFVLVTFAVACSQQVCPAYTFNNINKVSIQEARN